MKNFTFILFFLFCAYMLNAQTPDFSMIGFATINGGTTGGNSATSIIDVYTAQELIDAVGTKKNGGTVPRIIRVNGKIETSGSEIAIKECANLTIFGADENAFISKTPLIITNSNNIIIRNLKFSMVGQSGGKDIIEITTTSSNKSHNIWVDHCEFYNETPTVAGANSGSIKDKYDGLLDIKKNSEYITISWCNFHDHYKAILVGFTDSDTYDRKITMHHNRFERINSRVPSFRGGTAHIYNNYFEGWIEDGNPQGNCIHTREACNLLVENNYFTKINNAVYWEPKDASEGFAWGTGNYFAPDVKSGFTSNSASEPFNPPYADVYQDDVMNVPDIVKQFAGVGIITAYDDYGNMQDENKAPIVTIISPNNNNSFEAPATVDLEADVTDEDGTISKVEIYKNGELVETLTNPPYSYTFTDLSVGTYTLSVKAFDDKNRFTSRAVNVIVNAPVLDDGDSLFGADAPNGDYFWFGENESKINELINKQTITGTASFKPTKEVLIDNVKITEHDGVLELPKEGGYVVFKMPSCTKFRLFFTRTGSFAGNVYVSYDGVDWGNAVASLSGKKGILEEDYTTFATSASEVYVKIENTSTGGLNIHGAEIRIAKTGNSVTVPDADRKLISTDYYTITGLKVNANNLHDNTIYIKLNSYDDGSSEKLKFLHQNHF